MRVLGAALFTVAVLFSGCSELASFRLENATAEQVSVRLREVDGKYRDYPIKPYVLAPGEVRRFRGFQLPRGDHLQVSNGRCGYIFALSEGELYDMNIAGWAFPIRLRLAPDYSLEALKPYKAEAKASAASFGFPRKPLSRVCG